MFPGMNPRDMKNAMKRLGIKQEEIDAVEVIIKTRDKELIFLEPSVTKVDMMGQETYQIVGVPEEKPISVEPQISEDDIKTVAEQAQVSEEDAKKALEQHEGDLAAAIMALKEEYNQ